MCGFFLSLNQIYSISNISFLKPRRKIYGFVWKQNSGMTIKSNTSISVKNHNCGTTRDKSFYGVERVQLSLHTWYVCSSSKNVFPYRLLQTAFCNINISHHIVTYNPPFQEVEIFVSDALNGIDFRNIKLFLF